MEKQNGLIWLIVGLVIISAITSFAGYLAIGNIKIDTPTVTIPPIDAPKITDQDKTDIANLVISGLPKETPNVTSSTTSTDEAYLKDLSNLDEEKKAEELAVSELETRDFKKELMYFLNDQNESIDSYKDIQSIVVKDKEIDVSGESADVELEFKVYYFENGDDDESDLQSARVKVYFEINGLDEDENFTDAEILPYDETSFELIKFYEK